MQRIPDLDQRDRDGDIEPEDESRFDCACGMPGCVGYGDDPDNIQITGRWYAASCEFGKQRQQIAEGRVIAARADETRDDDDFNRVRR